MIQATNIQAMGNLIPDGTGNRNLGASNRYWAETYTNGVTSGGNIVINSNTPVLTLGVINSSTGNAKIQLYSKNSGTSNGFAIQYNKDTNIDRLEFIDGGGTAAFQFHNGGNAEFEGSLTASQINTGQGATEVHLMNQNVRTSDNVQFADLTLTGNLNLYGDINTQNVTNLDVTDKVITVGKGQDEGHSGGSGLLVDGSGASILWDESNDTWDFNKGIDVDGNINVGTQATDILIGDNLGAALEVKEGSNLYMRFNTTNGGEKIEINKPVEATFINASTGFRMASGQAIDFVSTNIGYNSIERNTSVGGLQINTGDTASMNILDNGNVGLNTTSPEEKLTISTGNVQFRKTASAANTSLGFLGWKNTYATGTHVAAKIDVLTRNESSNAHDYTNLVFYTWNGYNSLSEKMRIADDGNVGIGTASPDHKLTVAGANNSTAVGIDIGSNAKFDFAANSTSAYTTTFNMDDTGLDIGHDSTSRALNLKTGGSDRLTISGAGNVGIGETSPSHKITATSGTNGRVARLGNLEITTQSGTYTGSSIEVTGSNSFITYRSTLGHKFFTRTSGGGNTLEAMTIVPDTGNATFAGNVTLNSRLTFDYGGDHYFEAGTNSLAYKSSGGTSIMLLNASTLAATFAGKITAEKGVNYTGGTIAQATTVLHTNNIVYNIGGSNGIILSNADYSDRYYITNADHRWEVGSADAMRLNSTGLGIGTTSPAYKLDVAGDIKCTTSLKIDAGSPFLGLYNSGTEKAYLQWSQSSSLLTLQSDGDTRFITVGTERIRIKSDGKVGIGTASPTYKLSVPSGGIEAGGKITYSKSAGSLNATGYAVAGITADANGNGASCGFTFTCFGHTGAYQRIVYSCYNGTGTWYAKKVIDEGTNQLDVVASANGSTITFTFKATSSTMSYTPRVTVEATGHNINSTYA